jgi:hypothetical protein
MAASGSSTKTAGRLLQMLAGAAPVVVAQVRQHQDRDMVAATTRFILVVIHRD